MAELLGRHDALTREQLERHRGREVKMTGDGLLATFDGPARAVACATASRAPQRRHRRRVMGLARPNEELVSSTVKDLVAGAEIGFEDRSVHSLRGARQLAAVRGVHLTRS
jgi:hypothetical protein